MLFYLLALIIGAESLWDKTYLTWSLENGTNHKFLNDAIAMWNVYPLEFARVERGKGDIKIYFSPLKETHLGFASYPNDPYPGDVHINDKAAPRDVFYIIQHELGHALGLSHYNNSLMEPLFSGKNVSDNDRKKISDLYKCHFDSVTLLNFQTYIVFQGASYKILELSTQDYSAGRIWFPFIKNVDSMFRNLSSGNYIIISNDIYHEYDSNMKFIKQNYVNMLFPNVQYVDAVLTLRNRKVYVFENRNVYIDNSSKIDIRKLFWPIPNIPIRGAYEMLNGDIVLVDDKLNYIYSKKFRFKRIEKLCKNKIHCECVDSTVPRIDPTDP